MKSAYKWELPHRHGKHSFLLSHIQVCNHVRYRMPCHPQHIKDSTTPKCLDTMAISSKYEVHGYHMLLLLNTHFLIWVFVRFARCHLEHSHT